MKTTEFDFAQGASLATCRVAKTRYTPAKYGRKPTGMVDSPLCVTPLILWLFCLALGVASRPLRADESEAMQVSSIKIASPILSHRLFPRNTERVRGNAAVVLLRICANSRDDLVRQQVYNAPKYLQMSQEKFSYSSARRETPLLMYREMRRAALLKAADWDYPILEHSGRAGFAIDELPTMQANLQALAVHIRADIAEGNVDAALEKIRVGLSIIRHVQNTPVPLIKHTGAKILATYISLLKELVQSPDSVNLYWALTTLPHPLVDITEIADWVVTAPWRHVHDFDGILQGRTDVEWASLRDRLDLFEVPRVIVPGRPTPREVRKAYAEFVTDGRRFLSEQVLAPGVDVAKMTDDEVMIRFFHKEYSRIAQQYASVVHLPPTQAAVKLATARKLISQGHGRYVADYMPNIEILYSSVWNNRRAIAALRVVEALRDYAAREGGFPKSLRDLSDVPIPLDPVYQRPFEYTKHDNTIAILSGAALELPCSKIEAVIYRVSLR